MLLQKKKSNVLETAVDSSLTPSDLFYAMLKFAKSWNKN